MFTYVKVDTLPSYTKTTTGDKPKKKSKRARKCAQKLFTSGEKCAIRAKMTEGYRKRGVSQDTLLAMTSIQDLKAHPATAAILDQLRSHFVLSLELSEVLMRLQYEKSCKAQTFSPEDFAQRFPSIVQKASLYILSDFWHQNIKRQNCTTRKICNGIPGDRDYRPDDRNNSCFSHAKSRNCDNSGHLHNHDPEQTEYHGMKAAKNIGRRN